VSRFVEHASRIFEAAESTAQAGHTVAEMAILVSSEGGIRMIADSDWPLESLRLHHGAQMAFLVSQRQDGVRVVGRTGSKTCLFESARPDQIARRLLNPTPHFPVAPNLLP
jgi:hypothetical protein